MAWKNLCLVQELVVRSRGPTLAVVVVNDEGDDDDKDNNRGWVGGRSTLERVNARLQEGKTEKQHRGNKLVEPWASQASRTHLSPALAVVCFLVAPAHSPARPPN